MSAPEIPVSWGELIDKVTILEIKAVRLSSSSALANVNRELALLAAKASVALRLSGDVTVLKDRLSKVNEALWEIEDTIREKEARQEFDAEFIELARSVYKRNDERAAIKRQINTVLPSDLIEEKSYRSY
jgi:hypothetical protein